VSGAAATIPVSSWERCRLCKIRLKPDQDDVVTGVCVDCKDRKEAKRLRVATNGQPPAAAGPPARAFTEPERALIRAMHGYLPAAELLRILNERMTADVGADAPLYTLEQLYEATRGLATARAGADDWTSLRRLLADARTSGLLEHITPTLLEDFAVIFQLTVAQATHIKDVVQHAKETSR